MQTSHYIKEKPMFHITNGGWGCGYVVLSKGHRFHGIDYNTIMSKVNLCEELTYAKEDENGNWVVGWDAGHFNMSMENYPKSVVKSQTEKLEKELNEADAKDFVNNMSNESKQFIHNLLENMRVKE